jgi:hypothetical protein
LRYPQFHFDSFFSLGTPASVGDFQYPQWRGMVNIMALPNLQNFLALRLPTILEGPYGPTFQKIIESWFESSGAR